ncbi:MAG: FliA/WhiG family RNA polymerase sigma factor [Deltaproteobacteria bacterium]|nr:FliA/WhiG family RNA polymerase sigma factor [Deltaproteobacteria bacterium]
MNTASHRALSRYKDQSDDGSELVRQYASLIDRAARAMSMKLGSWNVYDDLWSAGAIGLIEAARRFDKDKDVKFESFVEHRVKGAMLDELRRMDHLPRRLRTKTTDLKKAAARLAQRDGKEPSNEMVAEELGISVQDVENLRMVAEPMLNVETKDGTPLRDGALTNTPYALDAIDRQEQASALKEAIGLLPDRLQTILGLRYDEGLSYKEIAQIFKVSEPRISQLHSDAVKKLRHFMG